METNSEVIVGRYGNPTVVLMAYAEYEQLMALRNTAKRKSKIEGLTTLAKIVQRQNGGLSETQAGSIADELTRDAVQGILAKRG